MPTLARDLVKMAEVQGRLGREVLGIELSGNQRDGLSIMIDEMTQTDLAATPPGIELWRYDQRSEPIDATVDPGRYPSTTGRTPCKCSKHVSHAGRIARREEATASIIEPRVAGGALGRVSSKGTTTRTAS